MLELLEKRLKTINAGKVLDVACGGGDFIGFIKEMASYDSITAIDCEPKMGEIIKRNFPEDKVEFIAMDATEPTFEANSFDTVCISNSLHHLVNPLEVLQKMKKVLKPDGYFVINEMRSDELSAAQCSHDKIHSFWSELDTKRGVIHNKPFPAVQIKELAGSIGLKEVEIFEYSFPIDEEQSAAQVQRLEKMLTQSLANLTADPDYIKLQDQADQILNYLKQNGFAPAPALFIIGKK